VKSRMGGEGVGIIATRCRESSWARNYCSGYSEFDNVDNASRRREGRSVVRAPWVVVGFSWGLIWRAAEGSVQQRFLGEGHGRITC